MNNETILLVEDNPDDVQLTLRAFRKNNIANEIVVASDGVEALDYLFGTGSHTGRDTGDKPKIILLDLKLPKLDGLQVLHRLRANDCTALIPVVILTSSKEEQDLVKGYQTGANGYVRKPVDYNEFLEVVHQIGLYWLLINEAPPAHCRQLKEAKETN